jgi:hypothetical protein
MTAPEASPLEARVGHYYQMDGTYLVGREKVREYAVPCRTITPHTGMSPPPLSWDIRTSWRR